jgi:hypothetical protein
VAGAGAADTAAAAAAIADEAVAVAAVAATGAIAGKPVQDRNAFCGTVVRLSADL